MPSTSNQMAALEVLASRCCSQATQRTLATPAQQKNSGDCALRANDQSIRTMEFILSESKIKENPLLFNAEMVRAILDGRKTQTRRAVKGMALEWLEDAKFIPEYVASPDNDMCPNGKIGDQIWVRETFAKNTVLPISDRPHGDYIYRAELNELGQSRYAATWTPSIHMPRIASRIQLEITGLRVERLNAISEDDAEAEGIEGMNQPTGGDDYQDYWRDYGVNKKEADGWPWFTGDPIASFKSLWNSIYKNWDENPWVWVIEFKVIKP